MKKIIYIIALAVAATACNNAGTRNTTAEQDASQTTTGTASTADLFEKEWKLLELNGKAIEVDTTFPGKPHLLFEKESNRVVGNGGCNGFGGGFELKGDDGIELTNIVSTQMACPNLELEHQFFEALGNAKSYRIENNTLTLNDENQEAIAKLELSEISSNFKKPYQSDFNVFQGC